ncbi:hypothetical protein GQ53DRAFT_417689 [Thozetella sp. PMI_491]|nr:hypothetical protein GQ53DRAFT_417689 [Thozetella sp. PMI_491]
MAPGPTVIPLQVFPITYQSDGIPLSDWIAILTLCLAPVVAHIAAGTPHASYLTGRRPKWHERVCHYNPTSILWRYAAIADRRIRARAWGPVEMAATNALFWTSKGWNGSEEMVDASVALAAHLPGNGRIAIFSLEMVKTAIVTAQGIQAITLLTSALGGNAGASAKPFTVLMAADIIFFPLAFIGLLRLCCSMWLTDDFVYVAPSSVNLETRPMAATASLDSLLYCVDAPVTDRFRPTTFWFSMLFRFLYLLPIFGLWAMAVMFLLVAGYLSATDFLVLLFFLVLLGVTAIIFVYYFARGRTTTTIIPCISSLWYKVYSGIIFALTTAVIIVACIETRKTPCGKYTSGSDSDSDTLACKTATVDVIPIGSAGPYFALASTAGNATNTTGSGQNHPAYQVYNFTGTCLGNGKFDTPLIVIPEQEN